MILLDKPIAFFKDLGINVETKVFNTNADDAKNFDISRLHETDAISVIGSKKNVRSFAQNNIAPNEKIASELGWELDETDYSGWKGPEKSPERNVKGEYGSKEYGLIGVSVSQTKEDAKNVYQTSFEETAGYLIAHGAGHLADKTHIPKSVGGIMLDGDDMATVINFEGKTLRQAATANDLGNKLYKDAMQRRFYGTKPVDNYNRTPRQRHEYYRHDPDQN